jgi:formate dehydrogenase alpha subunit
VLYLFQKLMRGCLGTNNLDSPARFDGLPTRKALVLNLKGSGAVSPISSIEAADVLLLVGSDIGTRYPLVGVRVRRALSAGAKVICVDPLSSRLAGLSTLHLQPKPGGEAALLRGLGSLMVSEGLCDGDCASRCEGFEEYASSLGEYDEAVTGVSREQALEAAHMFGDLGRKALVIYSADVSDPTSSLEVTNLLLLTGRTEKGLVPCLSASNAQGAIDMGAAAELYPGGGDVSDPELRHRWEEAWGLPLPGAPGLSALEMVEAAGTSVKGMYILGEDVPEHLPASPDGVMSSLSKLEFLLVQGMFLTESAKLADVVLPGVSFAESDGTITGVGSATGKLSRAMEPLTQLDWRTICEVSSRLG